MALHVPIFNPNQMEVSTWAALLVNALTNWAVEVEDKLKQLPSGSPNTLWNGNGFTVPVFTAAQAANIPKVDGLIVAFNGDPTGGGGSAGFWRWNAATTTWLKY